MEACTHLYIHILIYTLGIRCTMYMCVVVQFNWTVQMGVCVCNIANKVCVCVCVRPMSMYKKLPQKCVLVTHGNTTVHFKSRYVALVTHIKGKFIPSEAVADVVAVVVLRHCCSDQNFFYCCYSFLLVFFLQFLPWLRLRARVSVYMCVWSAQ